MLAGFDVSFDVRLRGIVSLTVAPATITATIPASRERNRRILHLHRAGGSLGEIAGVMGISRQRVRQVVLEELERELREEAVELALASRRAELVRTTTSLRAQLEAIRSQLALAMRELRVVDEEIEARGIDRLLGLAGGG